MPIDVLSPRILSLKSRQDQLVAAKEEAKDQFEQRRAESPTSKEIKGYVADFRALFHDGPFPERKVLIRNFAQGIEIVEEEVGLTYTIAMPQGEVTRESAAVLDFVQSGPPCRMEAPRPPVWRINPAGRFAQCYPMLTGWPYQDQQPFPRAPQRASLSRVVVSRRAG